MIHPDIIGLLGKKRSGKDTVAGILTEQHGYRRIAFADPLKAVALGLNPLLGRPAYPGHLAPVGDVRLRDYVASLGWEKAKEHPEVRRILQDLGLSVRENVGERVWLDAAMEIIDQSDERIVITDVRFRNEAQAVLRRGGHLWRIERPGFAVNDLHVSENDLNAWPTQKTILNDGTVEDLEIKLK